MKRITDSAPDNSPTPDRWTVCSTVGAVLPLGEGAPVLALQVGWPGEGFEIPGVQGGPEPAGELRALPAMVQILL